ncbi:MFS transporter [Streptomyces sp. NPDC057445]|uniref:MFS transporter n=1 Tax=Streptomyces sp. NPDC057445 TaxID=3346136 RepID=UPI0036C2B1FE
MLASSSCPLAPGVRRLERTLYTYAGLEDFVLLYPFYALLFAEHGLSTAEISSLFALWSLTGLLVEVPSGVWADVVSRRLMMVVGPLLAAAGFALWVIVPSYGGFAAGFVLWAVGGSLRSGAMEALVHDELERLGATGRYAGVMGRTSAVSTVATAAATAAAGPVFAWGSHRVLGAASIGACLLCSVAGLMMPENRTAVRPAPTGSRSSGSRPAEPRSSEPRSSDSRSPESRKSESRKSAGFFGVLRAGLREAGGSRPVRNALILSVALTSLWGALDEYVPLLAASTGVATTTVPWLVLIVWGGVTLGSLLVGPGERLSSRALGVAVATAAGALAGGAILGSPTGFVLVGAGFLVFQLADVLVDARLQEAITGPNRATVTSLAGLGSGLGTLLVYGTYAALSTRVSHGTTFALLALPYAAVALVLSRPRFLRPGGRGDEYADVRGPEGSTDGR